MFSVEHVKPELQKLHDFYHVFTQYRLVDPVTHEVYQLQGSKAVKANLPPCYTVWHRDSPCVNCISMRACRQSKEFIKMDQLDTQFFMVHSFPVKLEDRQLALELMADVTDSMMVFDFATKDYTEVTELISKVNNLTCQDSFTKLYNKQYIKDKLDFLCRTETQRPICLMFLDVNSFKDVNDRFGHMQGDMVLTQVANGIHALCHQNPDCWGGRMGGDEFCIVFCGYPLWQVGALCDELAEKLHEIVYQKGENSFRTTVSMGIGQHLAGEASEDFIHRVDMMMYQNKNSEAAQR